VRGGKTAAAQLRGPGASAGEQAIGPSAAREKVSVFFFFFFSSFFSLFSYLPNYSK
jgi:hypothetical protein